MCLSQLKNKTISHFPHIYSNRPLVQISQCTTPISHNAPLGNRNISSHSGGIFVCCIMGFVRYDYTDIIALVTPSQNSPLERVHLNFSMDKYPHIQERVWWNYLPIPKLQRLHRWSLGIDKHFHPTLYHGCNYLSMLGFKLNHTSKSGPRSVYLLRRVRPYISSKMSHVDCSVKGNSDLELELEWWTWLLLFVFCD